jgi:hypothetical protein
MTYSLTSYPYVTSDLYTGMHTLLDLDHERTLSNGAKSADPVGCLTVLDQLIQ